MQHHNIMARLDNRKVKLGVQRGLITGIAFQVGGFHLGQDRADHFKIRVGSQFGRALCRQPFHVAPKGDVVEHRFVMGGKEADQTGGKGGSKHISNKNSGPGTGVEQAVVLKRCNRFTQAGARDAQFLA